MAGSGYSGRLCINEVLSADDDIRAAIMRNTSSSELKGLAVKNGMTTMLEDGFEKGAGERDHGRGSITSSKRIIWKRTPRR